MIIRNTSIYPTPEVRELVKFATAEVDMRRVCLKVKNSRHAFRGMAYEGVPYASASPASTEYLVTVGIGAPRHFPKEDLVYSYKSGSRFPRYRFEDWREALVHLAAHEAKHIEQYKEGLSRSEVACEHFAVYVLNLYRAA